MYKIEISTDNAAFHPEGEDHYHGPTDEVCRLLRELADRLDGGMVETCPLYDANGNCVGHGIYEPDEEPEVEDEEDDGDYPEKAEAYEAYWSDVL
jgi:hypothetical protein